LPRPLRSRAYSLRCGTGEVLRRCHRAVWTRTLGLRVPPPPPLSHTRGTIGSVPCPCPSLAWVVRYRSKSMFGAVVIPPPPVLLSLSGYPRYVRVLAALSLPRAAVLLEFTCVEGGQGSAPGSGLTLGRVEDAFTAAGFAPAQRLRATDETQQYAPEVAAGAFYLRLMRIDASRFVRVMSLFWRCMGFVCDLRVIRSAWDRFRRPWRGTHHGVRAPCCWPRVGWAAGFSRAGRRLLLLLLLLCVCMRARMGAASPSSY
jgi:hypothetical protein